MRIGSALLALGLAGCFQLQSAKAPAIMGEEAVEHVIVSNYGWQLFGCLPIVCGNADLDSWCPVVFFRDEVRHELMVDRLVAHADRLGCDFRDAIGWSDRDVFFDFYYAPIPWLIQYREVNGSAVLVKREAER